MKSRTGYAVIILSVLIFSSFAFLYFRGAFKPTPEFYQGLTVVYTDGTQNVFLPSDSPALEIIDRDSGKTVSSIQASLYGKPTFTGAITGYAVTGSATWQVRDADTGYVLVSFDRDIGMTGTQLVSGQTTTLSSATITASTLESFYNFKSGGLYAITIILNDFEITLTFADGSKQSKTASTQPLVWEFYYQGSYTFSSFSVSWGLTY